MTAVGILTEFTIESRCGFARRRLRLSEGASPQFALFSQSCGDSLLGPRKGGRTRYQSDVVECGCLSERLVMHFLCAAKHE